MLEFVRRVADHGMRLSGARVCRQAIGDCEIGYYRLGTGKQPALLIHGIGDRAVHWQGIARALRDRCHMLIPDMPGCGRSRPPAGRTFATTRESLDILHALIEPVAEARPWLIGHSLGGLFAAKMMLEAPQRYGGLVMINPGGILLPDAVEQGPAFRNFLATGDRMAIFNRVFHEPPAAWRLIAPGIQQQMRSPVVLDYIDAMGAEDMIAPAEVARLPAHGLLFLGEEDRFLPPGTLDAYAAHFPGRVVKLARSAHASQVECAAQIAAAIRQVLDATVQRGAVDRADDPVTPHKASVGSPESP